MEELREEVDVKESFRWKLMRRHLTGAGHVERVGGERLTKRADALRMEGRRRREGPILRRYDCLKRYMAGVEG